MKLNPFSLLAPLAAAVAVCTVSPAALAQGVAKAEAAPVLCAVRGEEIKDVAKAAGKAEFKGKTYYFCCAGCVTKFDKSDDAGKTRFAKMTDLRTRKAVLAREIDAVNGAILAAEKADAPKTTEKAPTGTATSNVVYCAVTGEEIGSPDKASGKAEFKGKTYYFCCAGCEPKFKADPAKFAAAADKRATAGAH